MANLFLEESVLDDLNEGLGLLEVPLSLRVFNLARVTVILILMVVIGRVFYLSVINGEFYKNRALVNAGLIVPIPTERGIIFDRYNKPLVKNIIVYKAVLKLPELFKEKKINETLLAINSILGISFDKMKNTIDAVDLERQNSVVLSANLNEKQALELRDLNFNSIKVEEDFQRDYFDSKFFSHVLGYIGPVSLLDLRNNSELSLNDMIGKTGIEKYYDNELRGEQGKIIYYRNAKGEIVENKFINDSQPGKNIKLTIDSAFQNYFYNRLSDKLRELGSSGGVGIAMNYSNGEILSLVSLPSFDANNITLNDINGNSRPLFNRAVSGVYSPGSTVKPLVAFAALKENVINPEQEIFSRGYIEIQNPYFPDKPSKFVDWKPQGWVDVYSALARSSNVYFYAIGGGLPASETGILRGINKIDGLGIYKLKEYWNNFGFSQKTGIDISGETNGFLPDPERKKERTGDDWRVGDTYNVSIGQGDLLITPIELLSYISGIANYGKFYKPHLAASMSNNNDDGVEEIKAEILRDFSESSNYFKIVENGMIDVVKKPYGTANMLNNLPVEIAAKTGTAQIQGNKKINAFFVGYITSRAVNNNENKIVILVLIENAREGGLNAVPVAKDVFKWYYDNRIKSSNNESIRINE